MTITRGDDAILDRRVQMGAGEALRQLLPIDRGAEPRMHVHVEAPHNALDVDDDAYAWIEHAKPVSITVVGQETGWLRPLFSGDPDVKVTFVDPSKYDLPAAPGSDSRNPATEENLVVFDRWAPHDPPARPAIYVAPPEVPWLASASGVASRAWDASEENRPRWETPGTHPVVQGVDPLTLKIEKARAYGAATLTPIAQSARSFRR